MTTLADLQYLFTDGTQEIKVFNIDLDDVPEIYSGEFQELPTELEDVEVSSIDTIYDYPGYIGINVTFE